jgi:hypothetical protein
MNSVLGAEEERTLSQLLSGANKVALADGFCLIV